MKGLIVLIQLFWHGLVHRKQHLEMADDLRKYGPNPKDVTREVRRKFSDERPDDSSRKDGG